MAEQINKVHLCGRAGRDAETKFTSSGKQMAKFSLATGGGKKKDGSGDWPTDWHSIIAWGDLAANAAEVKKGNVVEVTGRLSYNQRTDKEGHKHNDAQVVINTIQIGGKREESRQSEPANREPVAHSHIDDGDSIPF